MHLCACLLPIANRKYRARRSYLPFLLITDHHRSNLEIIFPFCRAAFLLLGPSCQLADMQYLAISCNTLHPFHTVLVVSIFDIVNINIVNINISSTSISCNIIHPYRPYCQHQHIIIIVSIISTTQPYCPYRQHQHIIINIVSVIALASPAPSTSTRPKSSKKQAARQKLTNSYESMGALELQLQPKLHIVVRTKHL